MNTLIFFLLTIPSWTARPGLALELSLEENRARRGSIGYVDMQKLFKSYPETSRAKENFEEVVRQAEEQINLKKTELLRLRHELSDLKAQRELVAKTPMVISPPPDKTLKTAAPKEPVKEPVAVSSPAVAALPGFSEISTATAAVAAPAASTTTVAAPPAPTPAAPAPERSHQLLSDMDAQIAAKTADLTQKEAAFKDYQTSAEKDLIDLESRKTEILLGKIYKAIQEIARREGVGVIVDKGSILYGHEAVDLTEKVLAHLRGP